MAKYSLEGINGNAFNIMAYVCDCMKRENKTKEEIKLYTHVAMSGNYSHLLKVSQETIDFLNNEEN